MATPLRLHSLPTPPPSFVGECIDDHHPTLVGRVQIRWSSDGASQTAWLPTLMGTAVRQGDRVLITQPDNWDEPVVMGVIDGFARRAEPERTAAATIALKADEAVRVCDAAGGELFTLAQGPDGAQLTFAQPSMAVCVDGELSLRAKSLTLKATAGEARIEASDDVVVRGDNIHLN